MRRLIFVLGFLLTAIPTKGNTVYIASGGTGAGTSCASAKDPTYFNTSANWTTGTPSGIQIGPGTIVHLCGTLTGAAGTTLLRFQGSGASGSPITLLFEQNAVLTAPYWPSGNGTAPGGGAINLAGQGYLVVDGGSNGVIENSDNGSLCSISPTPSPCFNNAQNSLGISATATHDVTIRNLIIRNIYVHTSTNDGTINMFNDGCIMFPLANNITIDHVTAHDAHWCFQGAANNLTISNSEVYNADHGVAFGVDPNVGVSVGGLDIHGNHFHDFANWDTTNDRYHHDYIHLWDHKTGTALTDGVIYNNTFDGLFGSCCTTANVFLEEAIHNVTVFNNTFIDGGDSLGQYGVWMAGLGLGGQNNSMLNNYFSMGPHVSGSGTPIFAQSNQSGLTVENNIVIGGLADISITGTINVIDYNIYDDLRTDYGDLNAFKWNTSNSTWDFATWKSECHCDTHSVFTTNANIKVNSVGMPQPGSPAIGAGTNLTSMATGALAPLAFDKNGVARPTTGNWDIGAFQQGTAHPISVVQVKNPTYAKNTTMTVSLTETAGNFLVAATGYLANVTASVTDSLGNTWHPLTAQGNSNSGCGTSGATFSGIQLWYAENIRGGANVVTLQLNAQTFLWIGVIEYSGVKTSGSLSASNGSISTTVVSSISTGNLNASGPNNLIVAAFNDTAQHPNAMSAGAGYTYEAGRELTTMLEDRVSAAPGTYNPSASYNNPADNCGAAVGAAFISQ